MAVSIRLARRGKTKQPHYFIVAQDDRKSPKGAFLEKLGFYNPRTNPITLQLDLEKVQAWIKKGAKSSVTVARLVRIAGEGPQMKRTKTKKFGKKREAAQAAAPETPAAPPAETKQATDKAAPQE